jgi:hypothetical protein
MGMKTKEPLLSVGTFGTHVLDNPAGKFSFVGTVPTDLGNKSFETESDAIDAFVAWYRSQTEKFQREHCSGLRTDIFAYCLTGTKEFV